MFFELGKHEVDLKPNWFVNFFLSCLQVIGPAEIDRLMLCVVPTLKSW